MSPRTTAQPARATTPRPPIQQSVIELEVPPAGGPDEIVVTAVVPVKPTAGGLGAPGFALEGIPADVHPLARDAHGQTTSVVVSAPVDLRNRAPGSFARLRLETTGEGYQPTQVRDVPEHDLEIVLQTPDGIFRAKPFADRERGERKLGRWRSTWKSWAILENPGTRDTRGLVIANLELRADGLAVVEILTANAIQLYAEQARHGGDFCYQELEFKSASAIVIPLPRAGERVVRDGAFWVARLVDDGQIHLWPRMLGCLRRIVLAPPNASPALLERARLVGQFYGTGFAIEGPNSWMEAGAHGPELGKLAPWTDALDYWGPRGQAAARRLLESQIGGFISQRMNGAAGGYFEIGRRGLFHPVGTRQEGAPGGWKIRPVGSFALDRRLLVERWIELEHGLDRSRVLHFEPRQAKPTVAHLWAERFGGRVPFTWKNYGDGRFPWMRFARNSSNQLVRASNVFQGRIVVHQDGVLLEFDDQDDQHDIRDSEPPETLARFTGSSIALAICEVHSANGELARHALASPAGDVTMAKLVAGANGRGTTSAGRGLAWDLRAFMSFWEFAPDSWRNYRRVWAQTVARWALTARGPAGLLGNDVPNGHTSSVAVARGAPAGFRYVQTFEEAYVEQSLEQIATLAMPGTVSDLDLRRVLQGIGDAVDALWSVRFPTNGLVSMYVAVGQNSGPELAVLERARTSPEVEATWLWGLLAVGARVARRQGDEPLYRSRLARLLQAGRPDGNPAPNFEQYVRAAQALEREPWRGSADYSALAWGEAWSARTPAPAPSATPETGG